MKPKNLRPMMQTELAAHIIKFLERHGHTRANSRQLNAVYDSAHRIITEFESPTIHAAAGIGFDAWLKTDDAAGSSCRFMAAVIFPGRVPNAFALLTEHPYPTDGDDFGRCYRFLQAVPEAKERLSAVANAGGAVWRTLIEAWPRLTALHEEDSPALHSLKVSSLIRELTSQSSS